MKKIKEKFINFFETSWDYSESIVSDKLSKEENDKIKKIFEKTQKINLIISVIFFLILNLPLLIFINNIYLIAPIIFINSIFAILSIAKEKESNEKATEKLLIFSILTAITFQVYITVIFYLFLANLDKKHIVLEKIIKINEKPHKIIINKNSQEWLYNEKRQLHSEDCRPSVKLSESINSMKYYYKGNLIKEKCYLMEEEEYRKLIKKEEEKLFKEKVVNF